jgi:serine protease Do
MSPHLALNRHTQLGFVTLLVAFSCNVAQTTPHARPPEARVAVAPTPTPQAEPVQPAKVDGRLPSLAPLIDSVKGAIVNVEVRAKAEDSVNLRELITGQQSPELRGAGSGFIIRADGLVLTNNHVVARADSIRVKLEDGRDFDATVLGTDPLTDLAVIKLKGEVKNLPVLALGDSDSLRVGDWVVAIGNPFGLATSVSAGIVSAKARNIGAGPYDDFLQTDAAINPGNSGGPLFDLNGQVVGINTAMVGGGSGIGFAVPSSFAKALLPQLEQGEVVRGWLGVGIQDLTRDLAKGLKVEPEHGAVVTDVQNDTPGAQAGLKVDDVITGLNGKQLKSAMELSRSVGFMRPGSTVTLTVWRDGKPRDLRVALGKRPDLEGVAAGHNPKQAEESASKLGLAYDNAAAHQRGAKGAVITRIDPGSPADRAQLQEGMVIVEADGQPVRNAADLTRILAKHHSGDVALLRIKVENGRVLRALPIS